MLLLCLLSPCTRNTPRHHVSLTMGMVEFLNLFGSTMAAVQGSEFAFILILIHLTGNDCLSYKMFIYLLYDHMILKLIVAGLLFSYN